MRPVSTSRTLLLAAVSILIVAPAAHYRGHGCAESLGRSMGQAIGRGLISSRKEPRAYGEPTIIYAKTCQANETYSCLTGSWFRYGKSREKGDIEIAVENSSEKRTFRKIQVWITTGPTGNLPAPKTIFLTGIYDETSRGPDVWAQESDPIAGLQPEGKRIRIHALHTFGPRDGWSGEILGLIQDGECHFNLYKASAPTKTLK